MTTQYNNVTTFFTLLNWLNSCKTCFQVTNLIRISKHFIADRYNDKERHERFRTAAMNKLQKLDVE